MTIKMKSIDIQGKDEKHSDDVSDEDAENDDDDDNDAGGHVRKWEKGKRRGNKEKEKG